MKKEKYRELFKEISTICLYLLIILIMIDIKEIKKKVTEIENNNTQVHEYILNRIGG